MYIYIQRETDSYKDISLSVSLSIYIFFPGQNMFLYSLPLSGRRFCKVCQAHEVKKQAPSEKEAAEPDNHSHSRCTPSARHPQGVEASRVAHLARHGPKQS